MCLITVLTVGSAAQAQARAEKPQNVALEADLDGDGVQDSFAIVCLRGAGPGQPGEFCVQGRLAGRTYSIGPYTALEPAYGPQPLPDDIGALQILPAGALAALDVNLDGCLELVARLRLASSRLNVLTLVIAWDPGKGDLVGLWESADDGVLCMDASGQGDLALLPYALGAGGVPVFSRLFLWRDGQYHESLAPLPSRLAELLSPTYARRIGTFDISGDVSMLSEYVRTEMAGADLVTASAAVERALGELEEAEARVKAVRRQALLLRGDVFVGMGLPQAALETYRQAFALEPEEGIESPEGFAAFRLALAMAAAGNLSEAAEWLDKAEQAEQEPGKFQRTREALVPP